MNVVTYRLHLCFVSDHPFCCSVIVFTCSLLFPLLYLLFIFQNFKREFCLNQSIKPEQKKKEIYFKSLSSESGIPPSERRDLRDGGVRNRTDRHRGVQGRQETRQGLGLGRPGQMRAPQEHVQTLLCGTKGFRNLRTRNTLTRFSLQISWTSGNKTSDFFKQRVKLGVLRISSILISLST